MSNPSPPPEVFILIAASVGVWVWFFFKLIKSLKTDCEHSNPPRSFDAEHELGQEWERRMRDAG